MKDVRNKVLRNRLNKLGIKDIGLNFDGGYVLIFSDDDFTDTVLSYGDNFVYGVFSFSQYSVEEWINEITSIYDKCLKNYGDAMDNMEDNHIIKINGKFKSWDEE